MLSSLVTAPSPSNLGLPPRLARLATAQGAVLALVAVVAFAAGIHNVPLWDDVTILGRRLAPEGCEGFSSLWRTPYWASFGPPDTYRPLGLSLLYAERLAFGLSPAGYRCVSIALHLLVCLAAWRVLSRWLEPWVGWVGALLFAAHPVHAEAVGMAYGQLELLAALFAFLALGLHDLATREGFRPLPYALALLCAAAAACSKESGVMLPALLLVARAYREWRGATLPSAGRTLARALPADAAFWLVAACFLYARHRVLGTFSSGAEATVSMDYPLVVRLRLLVVSAGEAVRLCVFPTGQTVYYGHLRDALFGSPLSHATWLSGAALAVWWLAGSLGWRVPLLAVAWFGVTFFPVSNVIPSGVVIAERTLYLPVLGVCLLTAASLHRLLDPRKAFALAALLIFVGVVQSNRVVHLWRDDLTLWRSTVAAHPRSPQGQLLLGEALVAHWQAHPTQPPPPAELDEATEAFRTASDLNPILVDALNGSATVALLQGNRPAARELFLRALALDPQDHTAQRGLEQAREP